jgi:hypothetical protein
MAQATCRQARRRTIRVTWLGVTPYRTASTALGVPAAACFLSRRMSASVSTDRPLLAPWRADRRRLTPGSGPGIRRPLS